MGAIITGLQSAPVARLKKTFALLPKRIVKLFSDLVALATIDFKGFFNEYSKCNCFCHI
jgi:hypothetical protein